MKKILLGAVFLILFLVMGAALHLGSPWIENLDHFGNELLQIGNTESHLRFFKTVTHFGGPPAIVILGILVTFLFFKYKGHLFAIWYAFTLAIAAGIIPQIMKQIFQRERPPYQLVLESGYSFPSGHAAGSTVFYGLLIFIAITFVSIFWQRVVLIVISACLILLVSWSRIFLRVHYPSDVMAGILLGWGQIFISLAILKQVYLEQKR